MLKAAFHKINLAISERFAIVFVKGRFRLVRWSDENMKRIARHFKSEYNNPKQMAALKMMFLAMTVF